MVTDGAGHGVLLSAGIQFFIRSDHCAYIGTE